MVTLRPIAVRVNGIEVNCRVAGEGEGVLLVTGAGARATLWSDQARWLVAAGFRVVSYDLRGTGAGQPDEPFQLDHLVDDAVALIDALRLGPCRIAGFSLGATIAQEVAIASPGLVRRLALIAASARVNAFRTALLRGHAEYLRGEVRLAPEYQAALAASRMFAPGTLGDDQVVGDWLSLMAHADEDRAVAWQYEAAVSTGDRRPRLPLIPVPTLLIGFEHDLLAPVPEVREVAGLIPDGRFAEVAGCGHLGIVERPGEVSRLLLDFFAPP